MVNIHLRWSLIPLEMAEIWAFFVEKKRTEDASERRETQIMLNGRRLCSYKRRSRFEKARREQFSYRSSEFNDSLWTARQNIKLH